MKEIGVDIKIANADSTKFFGEWLPDGNFDIANFAWVGTPVRHLGQPVDLHAPAAARTTASTPTRRSTTCSTQAIGELDEAKAAELGNQIDQQLTADMATIPLYQKPTFIAWRNTFAGIGDNASQRGPVLERRHLGRRRPLRTRRAGKCSRRGPVGDRRPASAYRHLVTSPGEGAPCSASSSAGC